MLNTSIYNSLFYFKCLLILGDNIIVCVNHYFYVQCAYTNSLNQHVVYYTQTIIVMYIIYFMYTTLYYILSIRTIYFTRCILRDIKMFLIPM